MNANNARQTDATLPTTADMSSPQTCEAGVTRQPAESSSRALFSVQSTATESRGTGTGALRHRATTRPARPIVGDLSYEPPYSPISAPSVPSHVFLIVALTLQLSHRSTSTLGRTS